MSAAATDHRERSEKVKESVANLTIPDYYEITKVRKGQNGE